jgi:hypothetical protein
MYSEDSVFYFLRHKTSANELCAICESGWVVATVWIDYEDLFIVPKRLRDRKVIKHQWEDLPIVDSLGNKLNIPCHFIYT